MAVSCAAETELNLKPSICALTQNQTRCEERVDIRWHSDDPHARCLFVDRSREPLACWRKNRASGEFIYDAQTDESLMFELRDQQDDTLLASELFEVIREYTEFRSRRRKPWNFF